MAYLSKIHCFRDDHDLLMKINEKKVRILMIIFQDLSCRFGARKLLFMIGKGIYQIKSN